MVDTMTLKCKGKQQLWYNIIYCQFDLAQDKEILHKCDHESIDLMNLPQIGLSFTLVTQDGLDFNQNWEEN